MVSRKEHKYSETWSRGVLFLRGKKQACHMSAVHRGPRQVCHMSAVHQGPSWVSWGEAILVKVAGAG